MTVAYQSNASANADNETSTVITVPTVSDGNMMLMYLTKDGNAAPTTPTGWVLVRGAGYSSHYDSVWSRTASSEPSSYTITHASERTYGVIITFTGDSISVVDSNYNPAASSDSTAVITSITPASNNSAVVVFVGTDSGGAESAITSSWPSSLVIRNDNVNGPQGTGNASTAGAVATIVQTTAAAVSGNITLLNGSTLWATIAVVLTESGGASSIIPQIMHHRRQQQ
jgi:hypothetical protein